METSAEANRRIMVQKMQQRLQELSNAHQTVARQHGQVRAQIEENETVLSELGLVGGDDVVLKRVGPSLVRQDLESARSTVEQRLVHLRSEAKKFQKKMSEYEAQVEKERNSLVTAMNAGPQ